MKKNRDKLLAALFIVFIFAVFILFIALPKKEVSINEKRNLKEPVKLSISGIFNGTVEADTETYINDHFPARDAWVSINSYSALWTGRNGVNGVYKGKDGYLINTPVTYDEDIFVRNIQTVYAFADNIEIPVDFMIVPTTGRIMSNKLPKNHAPYPDDGYITKAINMAAGHKINVIDLREAFNRVKNDTQLYYKTDHHWTVDGAYEAYRLYEPNAKDKSEFEVEEYDGFFGTAYSKAALWQEKGESIKLYTYPLNVTVTISDTKEISNDMFYRKHLSESDKYPVFLDGNHSYVRIANNDVKDGRLLIIKDSYAHSLAPFLAIHNNVVDMVDLRYYLSSVSELVEAEKYDRILIVYGLSNLTEATDINILE